MKYLIRITLLLGCLGAGLLLPTACSDGDDCSIDGRSMINCNLFTINPDTKQMQRDTLESLTVTALGTDSILINKMQNVQSFSLPLRYTADSTVFILHYDYENNPANCDTLYVQQKNMPYFESLDCGYTVEQTILGTRHSKNQLDSVYIRTSYANVNGTENLQLFYHYRD